MRKDREETGRQLRQAASVGGKGIPDVSWILDATHEAAGKCEGRQRPCLQVLGQIPREFVYGWGFYDPVT